MVAGGGKRSGCSFDREVFWELIAATRARGFFDVT